VLANSKENSGQIERGEQKGGKANLEPKWVKWRWPKGGKGQRPMATAGPWKWNVTRNQELMFFKLKWLQLQLHKDIRPGGSPVFPVHSIPHFVVLHFDFKI